MNFKSRVASFWKWYEESAERFYETIEKGECPSLADEVSAFMTKTLPHLSWVFGPGEFGGHSFTVTGEGYVPKQLLAEYWLACAPDIPKWTFHASRQPTPVDHLQDYAISLSDGKRVDTDSFMLETSVDDETEKIDLVAWHPMLSQLDEPQRFQILFLLLDEALGEFGTQTWIGEIKVEPIGSDSRTISIAELPKFIRDVNAYHRWEKLPPLRSYSVYELREQNDHPRGDTIVGSTVIPNEVFDLIESDGKLPEDPLDGTGARLAYLAIDTSVFPEGQESDVRANIEDALDDAMEESACGRTLGGAFGIEETYIDLLLLDGEASEQVIRRALADLQLGERARIAYFA